MDFPPRALYRGAFPTLSSEQPAMSLTDAQVRHVAHLARLQIDDQRLPALRSELDGILAMVDALGQADTQAVSPMAHPLNMAQRLRADAVTESDQRDRFQSIAPAAEEGLYRVPKVIE